MKLLNDEWLSKVREIFEILPKPRSQIIFKGKYALSEVVKLSNIRNDSSKSLYEIKEVSPLRKHKDNNGKLLVLKEDVFNKPMDSKSDYLK